MRRVNRIAVGAVALALVGSGCFGPFHLTRKLYQWNDQVSQDKWVKELVFLVLAWVPVYSLAGLGDALIFNTIEFWTGNNPIQPSAQDHDTQTRRIVRQDAEAVLHRMVGPDGQELVIEQFHQGHPAEGLRIKRIGGVSVASDMSGQTLFTAQTLPDGSLLITDAKGARVAFYSAQEVERLAKASRIR